MLVVLVCCGDAGLPVWIPGAATRVRACFALFTALMAAVPATDWALAAAAAAQGYGSGGAPGVADGSSGSGWMLALLLVSVAAVRLPA
jgi:TRAP-type uncharacterized transport system fused permease subunit